MYRVLPISFLAALLALSPPAAAEESPPPKAGATTAADVPPPPPASSPPPASPAAPGAQAEDAKPEAPKPIVVTLKADVDLTTQRMTLSYGGKVQHTWPISSGVKDYETPTGTFRPQWMARMWYSQKYDLAPMPNAVFFKDGAAIHGSRYTHMLGRPASHGCVRLSTPNSEIFYNLVQKHGLTATRIVVHGQPKFREVPVASREPLRPVRVTAGPVHTPVAVGPQGVVNGVPMGGYYRSTYRTFAAPPSQGLIFPGDRPPPAQPYAYSRYSVPGHGRY